MKPRKRSNHIHRAVRVVGGVTELARKIGVSPQVVQNWKARGNIPPERVLAVEAATVVDGSPIVTRYDLRPDIYGQREAA